MFTRCREYLTETGFEKKPKQKSQQNPSCYQKTVTFLGDAEVVLFLMPIPQRLAKSKVALTGKIIYLILELPDVALQNNNKTKKAKGK